MNRDSIRSKISEILSDLFEQENLLLTDASTAEDFEGWDSITHVRLLIGLKSAYGFQFDVSDASATKNVGELVDLVTKNLPA